MNRRIIDRCKYKLILIMVFLPFIGGSQKDSLQKGHIFLQNGEFEQAIDIYQEMVDKGQIGLSLFYNLGNAYYDTEKYPEAILNFEKALKLSPNNKVASHNLHLANTKIDNEFILVEDFFLKRWWTGFCEFMTLPLWTTLTILLLIAILISFYFYLFGNSDSKHRLGMRLFYPILVLFILSLSATAYRYSTSVTSSHAILMHQKDFYSGPDARSKLIYQLNPGTKVKILDQLDEWIKVELINKESGWLNTEGVEKI